VHLAITGTRKGLTEAQFNRVKELIIMEGDMYSHLHEGDCIGVDDEVTQMFQNIRPEITIVCHPPENSRCRAFGVYNEIKDERPYIMRDKDMVDASFIVWACPAGEEITRSGTWTTVRYARNQGKLITIIYPDGKVEYE